MVAAAICRELDALALGVSVVAATATMVGLVVGAASAVAENNREHSATACHSVNSKKQ